MTSRFTRRSKRRYARRRATVIAGIVGTMLLGSCASLFTDAARYIDDRVVGSLDITDSGRFDGFTILDDVVDRYDVFLAGEAHGVAESTDYAYKLFQYLHATRGVRTYVAEIGFAAGERLNAYVQGIGCDADLSAIVDASRGTYAWTREWLSFWRRLRAWNSGLDPGARIRVIGIDVEHQYQIGFEFVADLLPATDPPDSIAAVVADLRDWTTSAGAEASRDLAERALSNMTEHRADWTAFVGTDVDRVAIAVRAIVRRFDFYANPRSAESREAAIYRTFVDVYDRVLDPNERRLVGLWGSVHIPTAAVNGYEWLGARLQNGTDSPVRGRVFSIVPYYDRSIAMRTFPYRTAPLSSDRLVIRLFAPYARSVATLFYLDADGSPFRTTPALSPDGRALTNDAYQAAVLFTHARA
ncbi:MAG: hypothetical protein EA382_17810, partial [Spirochaetaceae bacterium]